MPSRSERAPKLSDAQRKMLRTLRRDGSMQPYAGEWLTFDALYAKGLVTRDGFQLGPVVLTEKGREVAVDA